MNTASRWLIALGLGLASAAPLCLDPPRAAAQEVQVTGPLAGAPAVRHMRVYRRNRLQIQPEFASTLVDEFSRTLFVGAQLGYHVTDWLGIQGFFDYGISLDTDLTGQIKRNGQRTDNNALSLPDPDKFPDQIGRLKFLTGVQATFIPLRGKLALFQALFVDTDFYVFAGAAFVNVEERTDVKGGVCRTETLRNARTQSEGAYNTADANCLRTQTLRTTRIAIAPTFGVGLSMFFTDFLAMTFEWRAFPFKWNTSGSDEGGLNKQRDPDTKGEFPDGNVDSSDRTRQFNQMFKVGFAFYLPPHAKITK